MLKGVDDLIKGGNVRQDDFYPALPKTSRLKDSTDTMLVLYIKYDRCRPVFLFLI